MKNKIRKQMSESDKVDRVYDRLSQISKYLQENKSITSLNVLASTINVDCGFITYLKNNSIISTNSSGYYIWNKTIPLSTYPLAKTCYDNYYKIKSLKQNKARNVSKNTVVVKNEKTRSKRRNTYKTIEKSNDNYWSFLGGLIKIKKW